MEEYTKHGKRNLFLSILGCSFFLVLHVSCSFLFNSDIRVTTTVANEVGQCVVTVSADFSSRSAFPSALPTTGVNYFATISYENNGTKYLGERLSNNGTNSIPRFAFTIPSVSGDYTITLFLCSSETYSDASCIASGSAIFHLDAGQRAYLGSLSVPMIRKTSTAGKGSVSLNYSFDSSLGVTSATVNATKNGVVSNGFSFSLDGAKTTGTLSASNLSAGVYTVTLSLKDSSGVAISLENPIQTITVYSGFETNKWFDCDASGSDVLTVLKATQKTFYVCGTDPSLYGKENGITSVTVGNDTTGDGSMLKPFKTVQKAVDAVIAANATLITPGSVDYFIYVDGTFTGTGSASLIDFSSLSASKKLNLKIVGFSDSHCLFKGSDTGIYSCIVTESSGSYPYTELKPLNLTLKNIDITGWHATYGGAIMYTGMSTYKLILDNVNIYANSADYGGGINIHGGGLVLQNGTVIGDKFATVGATESSCSNMSTKNGGGITGEPTVGASINITIKDGCYVAYNCCSSTTSTGGGGGVYLEGNSTLTMEADSSVQYNYVSKNGVNGGGIKLVGTQAKLTMTGGNIKGNGVSYSTGGGVYAEDATLIIDSAIISKNGAYDGGGVYVAGSSKFTMNGGTINNNTASSGGGVYIKDGTFTMNGGTINNNTASSDVYLSSDRVITIGGQLTPPDGASTVATIKPSAYTVGTQVLTLAPSSPTSLADEAGKFALSNNDYFITTEGKIQNKTITISSGRSPQDVCDLLESVPKGSQVTFSTSNMVNITGSSTIEIAGSVTLSGSGITSSTDYLFKIIDGGTVTLESGTYTGCGKEADGFASILIDGGELILKGSAKITTSSNQGLKGVCVRSGKFTMEGGAAIEGCTSSGLVVTDGEIAITSGTISRNCIGNYSASGIVLNGGSGSIEKLTVSNNKSKSDGGGLQITGGNYTFSNCEFSGNTSEGSSSVVRYGGGIYVNFDDGSKSVTFNDCTISVNTVKGTAANAYGGGIAIQNGKVTFDDDSNILNNTAERNTVEGSQVWCSDDGYFNNVSGYIKP